MRTTKVFKKNIKAYREKHRFIVNKGSSRSSKTWSVLQILYIIAKYSSKPLLISIVSRTLPHLKAGLIRDFEEILKEEGISPDSIHHKTDHYFTIGLSKIEYFGADNFDRVHGPQRHILFVNEAYFIKYDIFDQLQIRTTMSIFIDFNPITEFWYETELQKNRQPHEIHSTYQDNDYLPEGIKTELNAKLERFNRETEAGTITNAFKNWGLVYLFGQGGVLEGVIYENWRYAEEGEIDMAFMELSTNLGLDYGFYPDPDAMSRNAIDRKRKIIYIEELIYMNNNGTQDLIDQIKAIYREDELIIAESANPRTNKDLGEHFNLEPAVKRVGDKLKSDWIRELQGYEFVISLDSLNLAKELQTYVWSNKKAGIPIDGNDHILDEILYTYIFHSLDSGGSILGTGSF